MPDNAAKMLEQFPLGSLVESLGIAIANAQYALDRNAVEILKSLSAEQITLGGANPQPRTLLSLGFTPSFYHITEATVEAKVAFSTSQSQDISASASVRVGSAFSFVCASVNASYSNKYSFKAEGSSSIATKFVSIPPPSELADALASMRGPAPPSTPRPGATAPAAGSPVGPAGAPK